MSNCRSCNAEIVWAINESTGKPSPFDAAPDPKGRWAVHEDPEGGDHLVAYHDPDARVRYVSHFATCPNAQQHRRPR